MQEADSFYDGILFHTVFQRALKRALVLCHPSESTGSLRGIEDQQKSTACRQTEFFMYQKWHMYYYNMIL